MSGDLPYGLFADWSKSLVNDAIVLVEDQDFDELYKTNPYWADTMQRDGISTVCITPMYDDERGIIGYLHAVNFPGENRSSVRELMVLESYFVRMAVLKDELLERLEHVSNYDILTGAYNRNALKNRLRAYNKADDAIGVVYVDLNGLKYANDTYGHEAGDRLIILAVDILKKAFPEDKVYRAGGDEFVVILAGEIEGFEDKVRLLGDLLKNREDINFSIGYCLINDGEHLERAIERADAMMYDDKRRFYDRIKQK